jgi:hypothetical protein
MIRALEIELSGCWHMCHNEQMDHTAIAKLAYAEFNCGGEVLLDKNKHPFRRVNYPSSTDLFERLGVTPAISIAKGLEIIHRAETAPNFGPMDVQ